MAVCAWDTVLVDGVDLGQWALIANAEGLLGEGPAGGDLVEFDHVAGGQWQPGPAQPYTFDLRLLINSRVQPVQIAHKEALLAACKIGSEVTMTRRLTVGSPEQQVSDTCRAVIAQPPTLQWDLNVRAQMYVTLVVQNLDGGWTRA